MRVSRPYVERLQRWVAGLRPAERRYTNAGALPWHFSYDAEALVWADMAGIAGARDALRESVGRALMLRDRITGARRPGQSNPGPAWSWPMKQTDGEPASWAVWIGMICRPIVWAGVRLGEPEWLRVVAECIEHAERDRGADGLYHGPRPIDGSVQPTNCQSAMGRLLISAAQAFPLDEDEFSSRAAEIAAWFLSRVRIVDGAAWWNYGDEWLTPPVTRVDNRHLAESITYWATAAEFAVWCCRRRVGGWTAEHLPVLAAGAREFWRGDDGVVPCGGWALRCDGSGTMQYPFDCFGLACLAGIDERLAQMVLGWLSRQASTPTLEARLAWATARCLVARHGGQADMPHERLDGRAD